MKKQLLICVAILSCAGLNLKAQLVLTQQTPEYLIQNVLAGGGVTIQNVTFNGQPANVNNGQTAFFNGVNTNIGLDSGIVMATGAYTYAQGPNNNPSGSLPPGGTPLTVDADLQLIAGTVVFDCNIIEFDFVPIGDTVKFRYVFASEEYEEYVCSGYNDAFGFFISGPGITGPYTNNAKNIALVPGTTTPVAINTINPGVAGSNGTAANCAAIDPNWTTYNVHYTNNNGGTTIQYDGFTKVLEAVSAVQCNETYHLKIAISDAGDAGFDSGVFLEANSLKSLGVNISAITTTGDSTLIEGCNSAYFIIERPTADSGLTVNITFSGTATNGVDINNLPTTLTLPTGVTIDTLAVQAFFDGIAEGSETVELNIVYPTPCGPDSVTATLYIQDVDSLIADISQDTIICSDNGESAHLTSLITGGYGTYYYLWSSTSTDTLGDLTISPPNTTQYFLSVSDDCGNQDISDTVTVTVQCPIEIPNVITPNGDGINEFFSIKNIEDYPGNQVFIYNRWGFKLLEATNYTNNFNMEKFTEGVYYYVVDNKLQAPYAGFFSLFK